MVKKRRGPRSAMLAQRHVTAIFFAPMPRKDSGTYTARGAVTYCQRRLTPFSTKGGPHLGCYAS